MASDLSVRSPTVEFLFVTQKTFQRTGAPSSNFEFFESSDLARTFAPSQQQDNKLKQEDKLIELDSSLRIQFRAQDLIQNKFDRILREHL